MAIVIIIIIIIIPTGIFSELTIKTLEERVNHFKAKNKDIITTSLTLLSYLHR